MKMIRRIFGYVMTVIAVLVLTYGYVYWGNLFGEKTPAGQMIAWLSGEEQKDSEFFTNFSTSTKSETEPDEGGSAIKETEVEAVAEPVEPVIEQAVVAQDSAAQEVIVEEVEPQPVEAVVAEVSADQPVVVSGAEEIPLTVAETAAPEDMPKEDVPVVSSQDEAQPLPDVAADVNVAEAEMNELQKALFTRKLLMQARQAFHYRDYPTSIASYLQLIAGTQDNFDAYGELGNVYYYLGKEKEAAAAYYEAAAIFMRLGKIDRAADLMGTLSVLDTTKARQLLDLLDTTR